MNPGQDLPSGEEMHISLLSRSEMVDLLESVSIQCYDSESDAELREAVKVNILDGTIEL